MFNLKNEIINQYNFKTSFKMKSEKSRSRSATRLASVQIIYNSLVSDKDINELILNYKDSFIVDLEKLFFVDSIDDKYFNTLIEEYTKNQKLLIKTIELYLTKNWKIERIAHVDKAILYIGLIELKIMKQTNIRTIISEYVEIAYQLGGQSGFINKILDLCALEFRK